MLEGYKDYKETDIPWLQKMPSHWNSNRAKTMYLKMNRLVNKNDDVITCFRDGVVTLRKNRRTTGFTESIKEIGYQGIKEGDLVIHVMDAFAGAIGVSDSNGKGTPVYSVCEAKDDNYNNYYYAYIIREMAKKGFIQSLYRGIRERSSDFRYEVFGKQVLPIPPRSEQDQIVRYLDWKISTINKYIEVKKKQIELLKEQKQAVINQAVTKGLDSNVSLKDSGTPSIGKIPKNWHIRSFLKIANIKANLVHPEKYPDLYQVSPANIEKNTGRLLECQTVKQSGVISDNHYFYKGQILYSKIRPLLNKVTIAPFDGLCSADMYPIETILNTEYLKFYMLSLAFLSQLSMTGNRVKMPKINKEELSKILVAFPDEKEQQEIVNYLLVTLNNYDNLIDNLTKSIIFLQEYQTRLISDVVTGKVNVQGD